ncbi:hypothetical protein [Sinosporangium siamense]|uniref:Uncharacterized protein n=1 Tax=Sinosporangium siamense TaxID=1367973 RepID=A0A919RIP0_9ACTN|nr:hypothetical protein [Sinosporangium siamense]GII94581.1 hypothetical protein Ssi02_48120 [Sinosporangium siamense]
MQIADGAHHCDLPCRWCLGNKVWTPEKPHVRESGEVVFVRVTEKCRMCLGTGECMHAHPADRLEAPAS